MQLGIHRLQFFVEGLQFFLGGGQLLIGRLQFFIGGLQFLVARLELFHRGLHFLMGDLQRLAGLLQFLHQRGMRLRRDLLARTATWQRRGNILEDDDHPAAQGFGLVEGLHHHIDDLRTAIGADLQAVEQDGLRRVFQRLADHAGEGLAQAFAGHGVDVDVGLAGGGLQIFAGAAADVEDVAFAIHQHGGRRPGLLDELVGELAEVFGALADGRFADGAGLHFAGKLQVGKGLRLVEAAEQACLVVDGLEQVAEIADGFGAAEQQQAIAVERVIKQRQQFLLQLRPEVDQQVAAGEDVELCEGRIGDDVLRREYHHLANVFADVVAAAFFGQEVARQPGRRDIGGDVVGVKAAARRVDAIRVEIGGIDLQRKARFGLGQFHRLLEHHGQRVGFFTRRAGGHPGAQRLAFRMLGQQRRDRLGTQDFPDLGIAEEVGHADQQFLEQQIEFMRVAAQVFDVGLDGGDLVHRHAPFDAAIERVGLVEREIVAAVVAQQDDDLVEGRQDIRRGGRFKRQLVRRMAQGVGDASRQRFGRGDDIGHAGLDGAARHAVGLGAGRFLRQRQPGLFLDGAQAEDAVGTHAGEDDADGLLLAIFGEGAQEKVDRQAQAARRDGFQQV